MDAQQHLTADEASRLRTVTEAHSIRDRARGRMTGPKRWIVVDLALSTGLRASELSLLTWGDWQPRRRILSVWRLKRREPVRESLPVTDALRDHLEDWRAVCGSCGDSEPIVSGQGGEAMSRSSWRRVWQRACKAAGVPVLPIHGARHTCAHLTLERSGDLVLVQRLLGHSSPVTTSNMYGHVSDDRIRAALAGV